MISSMYERRTKRSGAPDEALQLLMEALLDRSEVRAVALVGDDGRIVAGTGMPRDLVGLALIAKPLARGEPCLDVEEVTRGTDVLTRGFQAGGRTVYLAALGTRVRHMTDAVRGVERILSAA